MPKTISKTSPAITRTLQIEGVALGLAACIAFGLTDGSWMMFALLILAPDLSMVGYLHSKRRGALSYNVGHTTLAPWSLIALSFWGAGPLLLHIGLIWLAHIGFDRAMGYGLKYASGFKDTHLARV